MFIQLSRSGALGAVSVQPPYRGQPPLVWIRDEGCGLALSLPIGEARALHAQLAAALPEIEKLHADYMAAVARGEPEGA